MLSLRSLAFILASAIRRVRALSCAALQCFPDIIGRKIATKIATRMAAAMVQSPTDSLHLKARPARERMSVSDFIKSGQPAPSFTLVMKGCAKAIARR